MPKTCTTTTFPAEVQTFQPLQHNRWLYILSTESNCVLHCGDEVSNHKLQGSGVITLPQGCKLHTRYSTLTAFQENEENTTIPIIVPDIRTDDCFELTKKIETPPYLLPIKINEMPLDSLNRIKTHLNKYSEELKKLQTKSKTQTFVERNNTIFTLIYFTTGMSLILYILIRICNRCPNGFIRNRRRRSSTNGGCVQIFNNGFDNSQRRSTQGAIPLRNLHQTTSCITDDEDNRSDAENAPETPQSQRSGANTRSLF